MPGVLISNNSELLRNLSAAPFRRMQLEVLVASNAEELVAVLEREQPRLVIVDAALAGGSGFDVARHIKDQNRGTRVVVVTDGRIDADQMRQVAECGCDEVLIAPLRADQLYDVVAIQLGLARRGNERYDLDLAVMTDDGDRSIDGRVTNLSVDGARLVLPEPMGEGTRLVLRITPDDSDGAPIEVNAKIVWAQSREESTIAGAQFDSVSPEIAASLSRLLLWEIVDDSDGVRVAIKGDMTEATSYDSLLGAIGGKVVFDLSQVEYINSLGVREWSEFLRRLPGEDYQFLGCSSAFVLQASMAPNVLGKGRVLSFFAPYRCYECDYEEERLLQTSTILAADNKQPPVFGCPVCENRLALDDLPERYMAFLS